MDRIQIYKSFPEVTFADVIEEMNWRYDGLSPRTKAKQYIDLMIVLSHHAKTFEQRRTVISKILLAGLVLDAFINGRSN